MNKAEKIIKGIENIIKNLQFTKDKYKEQKIKSDSSMVEYFCSNRINLIIKQLNELKEGL